MFKFTLRRREPVNGLSTALRIVDAYMIPDSNLRQIDFNAGYARGRIETLFEAGEITENEKEAALHVLRNQHERLCFAAALKV